MGCSITCVTRASTPDAAVFPQYQVMLLINNLLDCEDLEERVRLRADFSFLQLEDVIRVRCAAPHAYTAVLVLTPRHGRSCPSQHFNDTMMSQSGQPAPSSDGEVDFRELLNTQFQLYMLRAHEDAEYSLVEELQLSYVWPTQLHLGWRYLT